MKKQKQEDEDNEPLNTNSEQHDSKPQRASEPQSIVYGDSPIRMRCPHCLQLINTEIIAKPQLVSIALGVACFALVPNIFMVFLIIVLMQLTASKKHRCGLCEQQLGSDGKFLFGITDSVHSFSLASSGMIISKKMMVTIGLIVFSVLLITYKGLMAEQQRVLHWTWPQYLENCKSPGPCLSRYHNRQLINWSGHIVKVVDNRIDQHRFYTHGVTLYMKMSPQLHPQNQPDLLLTLTSDVTYYYSDLISTLKHGDQIQFNCTIHKPHYVNQVVKDWVHFHAHSLEHLGWSKDYQTFVTLQQDKWIKGHVEVGALSKQV